jgi:hypothetical protein
MAPRVVRATRAWRRTRYALKFGLKLAFDRHCFEMIANVATARGRYARQVGLHERDRRRAACRSRISRQRHDVGIAGGKILDGRVRRVGWPWLRQVLVLCREASRALPAIAGSQSRLRQRGSARCMYDRIETPGGGIILFQGMVMRIEAVRRLFP